jgi:hypothetical protein
MLTPIQLEGIRERVESANPDTIWPPAKWDIMLLFPHIDELNKRIAELEATAPSAGEGEG